MYKLCLLRLHRRIPSHFKCPIIVVILCHLVITYRSWFTNYWLLRKSVVLLEKSSILLTLFLKCVANIEWNISGLWSSFLFWTVYCWPEYVSRSHLGQFYAVYYYWSCSQPKFLVSYVTYDSVKVSTNKKAYYSAKNIMLNTYIIDSFFC